MELTFDPSRQLEARSRRQRRVQRAHWWFEQMRQIVDRAFDHTSRRARPEQIYLGLQNDHQSN
jgi:hypothetical protein